MTHGFTGTCWVIQLIQVEWTSIYHQFCCVFWMLRVPFFLAKKQWCLMLKRKYHRTTVPPTKIAKKPLVKKNIAMKHHPFYNREFIYRYLVFNVYLKFPEVYFLEIGRFIPVIHLYIYIHIYIYTHMLYISWMSHKSMDWFCWENLHRKPELFSHEILGA